MRFAALGLALLLALPAGGAEPSSPADPALAITPTKDGVLLSNDTFLLYLRTQVALEQCNLRVVARDALLQQEAGKAERSFLERHGVVVGSVVGFALAVLLVRGAKEVLTR